MRHTRSAANRDRVLTLLAARRGGTTRAEIANILDMGSIAVSHALRFLCQKGSVTMHGRARYDIPRYTLAADLLTRPVERKTGAEKKRITYRARVQIILAALDGDRARTHDALARLCGVPATRRFGILGTLQRMRREGLIELVGTNLNTRYRLATVKHPAAA